jgi:hypothetical protein
MGRFIALLLATRAPPAAASRPESTRECSSYTPVLKGADATATRSTAAAMESMEKQEVP